MPIISDLGKIGVVKDVLPYQLPQNAFSDGQNVRFYENSVEKFLGHTNAFSGEIESLTVPGVSGSFQVLNNHAPIVSTLTTGKVKIEGNIAIEKDQESLFKQEGSTTYFDIKSGVLEMKDNKVILLTD